MIIIIDLEKGCRLFLSLYWGISNIKDLEKGVGIFIRAFLPGKRIHECHFNRPP